jgi:NAD(P)-dependent dehydrogenase (short-subunit alcohol dehydrogenase family)
LITASGRIRPTAAFTAAASSASEMTGSASISFQRGGESGDRVSANTSCWFALRRLAARAMMNRIGEPEDIANAVVFLASPKSGWITAQVLTVDGGRMDYIGHG